MPFAMSTRILNLGPAALCFILTGCGAGPIGDLPVQWGDIPLAPVLGQILLWTSLGVLLGLVVGPFLFFLLRRLGAYRLDGRVGWWLRLIAFLFMLAAFPVLGGMIGYWEGMIGAVDVALRESPLGKDLLPRVGGACADGLCVIDQILGGPEPGQELDLDALLKRLDNIQGAAAAKLSDSLLEQFRKQQPDQQGAALEKWLEWLTPRLASALVERAVSKKLDEVGLDRLREVLRDEAARRQGQAITRAELGAVIAERVLAPGIMRTCTRWLRGPQTVLLAVIVAVTLLPIAVFWIVRRVSVGKPDASLPRQG